MKTSSIARRASLALSLLLPAALAQAATGDDFGSCLNRLQGAAQAKGVSAASFAQFTQGLQPDMTVLPLLDAQPEFTTPIWDYLAGLVDDQRVADGKARMAEHADLLRKVAARYQVDPATVVAVWGVESDYGRIIGKRPLLVSLSTLSCYGRRQSFFQGEFLATLKLLQQGDIRDGGITGSWAGAFGQTQFMPSTYARIAVDFDGDGRRDLVGSDRRCPGVHRQLPAQGWLARRTALGLRGEGAGGLRCLAGRARQAPATVRLDQPWREAHRRPAASEHRLEGRHPPAGRRQRAGLPGPAQLRRDLFLQRGGKLCAGHRPAV